ncbi:Hypothetical predicted protein [Xyrichtys novacula]|uniref:Uncharacterized protein n=1 Tax=Xyrichtys novacula TaxID=13765 RepID=A0AAV1FQU5_XYRNO|nr:Hypothetical predicted protein [Xyrichtys novacula]
MERLKATADHLLSRAHNALQSVSIPSSGPGVPHRDGGAEDGLDDGRVEVHHQLDS